MRTALLLLLTAFSASAQNYQEEKVPWTLRDVGINYFIDTEGYKANSEEVINDIAPGDFDWTSQYPTYPYVGEHVTSGRGLRFDVTLQKIPDPCTLVEWRIGLSRYKREGSVTAKHRDYSGHYVADQTELNLTASQTEIALSSQLLISTCDFSWYYMGLSATLAGTFDDQVTSTYTWTNYGMDQYGETLVIETNQTQTTTAKSSLYARGAILIGMKVPLIGLEFTPELSLGIGARQVIDGRPYYLNGSVLVSLAVRKKFSLQKRHKKDWAEKVGASPLRGY